MNKFLLIYIIFVVIWLLNICYELIKTFWTKFCVSIGRCPKCFRTFWNWQNWLKDYSYCQKHIKEAYYEDRTKVIFKEEI